jgi:hypothetical protein
MGIGDFLFGSSGDVEHEQLPTMSPEQLKLMNEFLLPLLQGDELTQNFAGPAGASLTALEQWAQNVFGGGVTEGGQAAQGRLTDIMNQGPQDIDNFFTETVQNPLLERFQEDILPGISRKFAPSGFYSSQRLQADQRAQEELIDSLTRSRADIGFRARESDLNRSAGIGSTLLQNELGTRGQLFNLGQAGQQSQENRATLMLQALGLRPFENVTTVTPGSTGLLQEMIGGAAQGLGTGFGMANPNMLKNLFGRGGNRTGEFKGDWGTFNP